MSILIHGRVREAPSSRGISDVCVSNGETIVRTDREGRYALQADPEEHRFLFITVPDRFRPRGMFFLPAGTWAASPDEVDFLLEPAPERARKMFSLAQITDTHVTVGKQAHLSRRRWLMEDLQQMVKVAELDLVVASGDLTNRGEPGELKRYLEAIRTSEVPVFSLFGGHDGNAERFAGEAGTTFTRNWETEIGPTYYSLDWGGRHIVLYPTEDGFFSPEDQQRKERWLFCDLAEQPAEKEIILVFHTPPSMAFLKRLAPYNIRLVLYGHWHSSKVFTYGNMVIAATPSLCFGGIDTMPRGFRKVAFGRGGAMGMELIALTESEVSPLKIDFPKEVRITGGGKTALRLLWHRRLDARLHRAVPVVAEENLLLSIIDEEGQGRQGISCLNARNGRRRWHISTDASIKNSAAISDGRCAAVSVTGRVYVMDTARGGCTWQADLPGHPERWVYTAPAIADGTVYVGARSGYGAYDLESGARKWYREIEATDAWSCYASPQIYEDLVVLLISRRGLLALDRKTGEPVWEKTMETEYQYPAPVITGDLLVSGGDASCLVVLRADSGEEVWQQSVTEARYLAGLTADLDWIYITTPDGEVRCYGLKSGQLRWQYRLGRGLLDMIPYRRGGRSALASPVLFQDRVVVSGCDGRLDVLDASGKRMGCADFGAPLSAAPCVAGARLYLGTYHGELYCFGSQ